MTLVLTEHIVLVENTHFLLMITRLDTLFSFKFKKKDHFLI